jgi:hypothetical protein
MATPKVSLQRCHYPRQWNMRPFSSGSSPSYIKIHKGILNTKNFIYDVCYGIYKHVVLAPGKAERPRSLPIIKWISPLRELLFNF